MYWELFMLFQKKLDIDSTWVKVKLNREMSQNVPIVIFSGHLRQKKRNFANLKILIVFMIPF